MKHPLTLFAALVATALLALTLSSCRDTLPAGPHDTGSSDTIAHWTFESSFNDVSGNGHDATPSGHPQFVPDRFGWPHGFALWFDGNTTLSVPSKSDLNIVANDSYTISAWVYMDGGKTDSTGVVHGGGLILSKMPIVHYAEETGYQFSVADLGTPSAAVLGVTSSGPPATLPLRASQSIRDREWHMVTLVIDAHKTITLYVDSISVQSENYGVEYQFPTNDAPLTIGPLTDSCRIDDILMLHHAMSVNEVAARFHEGGWYAHHDTTVVPPPPQDTMTGQWVMGSFTGVPFLNGMPNAMCWVDPATGYICGQLGVVGMTTDSGATWKTVSPMSHGYFWDLYGISFWSGSTGVAVGGGYQGVIGGMGGGGIYRTTDFGQTWSASHPANCLVLRDVKIFYDLRARPEPATAIAVGEDSSHQGMILISNDGGQTWTITKSTPHALYSIAVSQYQSGYAVIVGDAGQDFSTTDFGVTWSDNSQGSANFRGVSLEDPSSGITYDCVAISDGRSTFWSTDMGRGWVEHPLGAGGSVIAVFEAGSAEAFIAGSTGISRTTNRGGTWVNHSPPNGPIIGPWCCIGARDAHHIAFFGEGGFYWLVR